MAIEDIKKNLEQGFLNLYLGFMMKKKSLLMKLMH